MVCVLLHLLQQLAHLPAVVGHLALAEEGLELQKEEGLSSCTQGCSARSQGPTPDMCPEVEGGGVEPWGKCLWGQSHVRTRACPFIYTRVGFLLRRRIKQLWKPQDCKA